MKIHGGASESVQGGAILITLSEDAKFFPNVGKYDICKAIRYKIRVNKT